MSRFGKTIVHTAIGAVVALIIAYPVSAGTSYELKCSNCEFSSFHLLESGGLDGRLDHQTVAIGYCCECDQMVSIWHTARTPDEERKKLEQPVGKVFCFETGITHTLYACPHCDKPFAATKAGGARIGRKADKLYCPKCGEQTLEGTPGTVME